MNTFLDPKYPQYPHYPAIRNNSRWLILETYRDFVGSKFN